MDIKSLDYSNCSCGQVHSKPDMIVEIDTGLTEKAADILKDFPKSILIAADINTLKACGNLLDVLKNGGFVYTVHCYENCTEANIIKVEEIEKLAVSFDGILSVGTGSINDICRMAAYRTKKAFAIYATAASMDGFASNAAPITFGYFKETVMCKLPDVIIADTEVLAKAPAVLKSSGFGDIMAKYIALLDWKIASIVSDELFCPQVALLVEDVLERVTALADRVTDEDPGTAKAMMEALVLSGIAMALVNHTRPASASEHLLSHYWEMRKLERREPVAFHGEKVGVGTLLITKLYHNIADEKYGRPDFRKVSFDWHDVSNVFSEDMRDEIIRLNTPSVLEKTSPAILESNWLKIKKLIKEELPTYDKLLKLMNDAKAVTAIKDINIDEDLAVEALIYHPYLRHRINLTTLIPMMSIKPDYRGLL